MGQSITIACPSTWHVGSFARFLETIARDEAAQFSAFDDQLQVLANDGRDGIGGARLVEYEVDRANAEIHFDGCIMRPTGSVRLGDVLTEWHAYELDDSVYVPRGVEPALDVEVSVLPFDRDRKREFGNLQYLLGIEQVRDVIEGLERQLGRRASPDERLRAVVFFVRHDAFIDSRDEPER